MLIGAMGDVRLTGNRRSRPYAKNKTKRYPAGRKAMGGADAFLMNIRLDKEKGLHRQMV